MELHPILKQWFGARFEEFTGIQKQALRHTLAGRNTLILAPTGSGKTLAAFLSVLDKLGRETPALPNATRAVYVSPLRSLTYDIHRNLAGPLEALNAGRPPAERIRMEVRTGDTIPVDRARQQRTRPHLLLTTPETLALLLAQAGWRDGLVPHTVIVDEIHSFAESKRGSLLSLTLERLESRRRSRLQRIGLSATAEPVRAVKELLCGRRACVVAREEAARSYRLEIAPPAEDVPLPAAGYNPYRVAHAVAERVSRARSSLVFTSTRSAAERLGLALQVLLPEWEERIAVHHGSIDREVRREIEAGLASGAMKAVVCSSSLEMGVDFQGVDQVILIGAPRGVNQAVQRLGRSSHRVGSVAEGVLAPLSLADLLECVALREAVTRGRLDALRVPRAPLDVLAQALLAMSIERPWTPDEAFRLVRRAGPYGKLTRPDFDSVVEYLAGGGRVLGASGRYGKIVLTEGRCRVASPQAVRQYFLNAGTITDDYQVRIVTRGNRTIGSVEENFLLGLKPGEAVVIGGRVVRIRTWSGDTAVVEPAAGERVQTPRWYGGKFNLSARLANEELALRRDLRSAWRRSGPRGCLDVLIRKWNLEPRIAALVADYVARQCQATAVPAAEPVQVERLRRAQGVAYIVHVVAGRAVNRSLAWVAAHRLGHDSSIVGNHDDHCFLLSFPQHRVPSVGELREALRPQGFRADLERIVMESETPGKQFRAVAETGQLLPRRSLRGRTKPRAATWNAELLYQTFRKYEPGHPLVRETLRGVLEDQLDAERAEREAARLSKAAWETVDLPRPSPFALPLYSVFNREILIAGDPDKALEEMANHIYKEWERPS